MNTSTNSNATGVPKGATVKLAVDDMMVASALVSFIFGSASRAGDQIPIAAQLAFCKLHNTYPNFSDPWKGLGYNTLPVKLKKEDMTAAKDAENVEDVFPVLVEMAEWGGKVYGLMLGEPPIFRFAGYITEDELAKVEREGPGPEAAPSPPPNS